MASASILKDALSIKVVRSSLTAARRTGAAASDCELMSLNDFLQIPAKLRRDLGILLQEGLHVFLPESAAP
jgi:hypothetical protein